MRGRPSIPVFEVLTFFGGSIPFKEVGDGFAGSLRL